VVELTKELNRILKIETRLLIMFYSQTNGIDELKVGTVLEVLYRI